MNSDWQSWVAAGTVTLTGAVFLWRTLRKKKAGGCGSGCGCGAKKPVVR